jgi:Rab-like protein 5
MPHALNLCATSRRLRRIQELSRAIGTEQVKLQLWDVSGKQDYQTHWPALAQVCGRPCCSSARCARLAPSLPGSPLHSPIRRPSRVFQQEVDGVMLLLDPSRPEQERELEQLYVNFAQSNRLTTRQCMVLAVHVDLGAGQQPPEWQGG